MEPPGEGEPLKGQYPSMSQNRRVRVKVPNTVTPTVSSRRLTPVWLGDNTGRLSVQAKSIGVMCCVSSCAGEHFALVTGVLSPMPGHGGGVIFGLISLACFARKIEIPALVLLRPLGVLSFWAPRTRDVGILRESNRKS